MVKDDDTPSLADRLAAARGAWKLDVALQTGRIEPPKENLQGDLAFRLTRAMDPDQFDNIVAAQETAERAAVARGEDLEIKPNERLLGTRPGMRM